MARVDPAPERADGPAGRGGRPADGLAVAADPAAGRAVAVVDKADRHAQSARSVIRTGAAEVAGGPASWRGSGRARWGDAIPAGSRGTALAELSPTPCCPMKRKVSAASVVARYLRPAIVQPLVDTET
ncbi:hypothetical protein MPRG_24260 [Mycobacterium paragordonae]|uniref:Uncharacterized protein n=1 Tax=Mycobacterium paragordonae TaxID=1389713 RepID=A0ABQ1C3X8_9MYCO|nr:hypothetical protein MPRG_24260 [Mycobacterium paragordonae]